MSPEPTPVLVVVVAPTDVSGIDVSSASAQSGSATPPETVVLPMRSHAQFNGFQWLSSYPPFSFYTVSKKTDSCYIFKLDMLRDHKPPPIRRIRISDFGLLDLKRDPDRHQNCITWSLSHAIPLQNISSKSVHKFASNPTDRQTNRPHRKHNLLLRRR